MKNKNLKNTAKIILILTILASAVMLSGCIQEVKTETQIEQKNSGYAGVNASGGEIKEAAPLLNQDTNAVQFPEVKINEFDNNSVSASFKIDGMTCGGCVEVIKSALSTVNGVKKYDVYLGSPGKAVVEYDPAAVTPDEIAEAITKSGYTAAVISSVEASGINATKAAGSCGGSACGSKNSGGGCGCSK